MLFLGALYLHPNALHVLFLDVNTLVCGRCGSNQYCVSRDKITYSCAAKRRKSKQLIINILEELGHCIKIDGGKLVIPVLTCLSISL